MGTITTASASCCPTAARSRSSWTRPTGREGDAEVSKVNRRLLQEATKVWQKWKTTKLAHLINQDRDNFFLFFTFSILRHIFGLLMSSWTDNGKCVRTQGCAWWCWSEIGRIFLTLKKITDSRQDLSSLSACLIWFAASKETCPVKSAIKKKKKWSKSSVGKKFHFK